MKRKERAGGQRAVEVVAAAASSRAVVAIEGAAEAASGITGKHGHLDEGQSGMDSKRSRISDGAACAESSAAATMGAEVQRSVFFPAPLPEDTAAEKASPRSHDTSSGSSSKSRRQGGL
ncbi:MAG: hypothetical protein A3E87_00265 [Gammaproteobacteria bacterium RIFCSPHIGHO2_12_FULL_35_23]|nr:MAG: hypothetical protein A3E87_00265 [Gammaproteobacteria bacterium RIFCSPHIGHO2_12_FULL_35_23]